MALTPQQFAEQLVKVGLLTPDQIEAACTSAGSNLDAVPLETLARRLVKDGKLTKFQAQLAANGKSGQLVLGNYVVLEQLGQGGMGTVYRARHRTMKREVALKVISPAVIKDEMSRKRFQREVEAAAQLTHPNIVTAHDAGEVKGTHFLVMELVKGSDLKSTVRADGIMPPGRAVDCIIQTARGLAFAHGRGIVHRDIKPANLLLDETGTIKILDMGLARFEEAGQDHASVAGLTGTGVLMGTVDFMSPEQAIDSKTADARSDIYSLGCTLYFLLSGKAVFEEDTVVKRLMAHQSAPAPRLPLEDPELQRIFEKSIAKKAEDRYQTAHDLIADLEAWRSTQPSDSLAASPPGTPGTESRGTTAASIVGRSIAPQPGAQSVVKSVSLLSEVPQAAGETTPSASPTQRTQTGRKSPQKSPSDPQTQPTRTKPKSQPDDVDEADEIELAPRKKSGAAAPPRSRGPLLAAAAGAVAVLVLLGVMLLRVKTPIGTIVIETSQPDLAGAEVLIDETQKITLKTGAGQEAIEVQADDREHLLKVTKGGFETFTQKFTVKGGQSQTITVRLEPAKAVASSTPPPVTGAPTGQNPTEPPKPVAILDDPSLPAVDPVAERKAAEAFLAKMTSGRISLRLEDDSLISVSETQRELPKGRFAIEELFVHEGKISAVETALLKGCPRIKSLGFPRESIITAEILAHAGHLKALELLSLGASQVDAGLWKQLESFPKLRDLMVQECRFQPAALPVLSKPIESLRQLAVSGSRLTNEDLQALAPKLPNVAELWINQDDGEQFRTLAVLKQFPKVVHAGASPNQLNAEGVEFIRQQGVVNNLSVIGRINDQTLENITPLSGQLKQLDFYTNALSTTPPTRRGFAAISRLTNLEAFAASGNQGSPDDFSLQFLAALPKLNHLAVSFPIKSHFADFPEACLLCSAEGLDSFRKTRPDVRLIVNEKTWEPTAKRETVSIPPPPSLEVAPKPSASPTEAVERQKLAGTLGPADARLNEGSAPRPPFTQKLKANSPLGEFAAVNRPSTLSGVLSWSIESINPRGWIGTSALSSQGIIATGTEDGLVRLWSDRWQLLKILPGHQNGVTSVCFSPDGTRLVSVANDPKATVAMWDVSSGQLLWIKPVNCWGGRLSWSPDSQRIAACEPNKVDLINPETGQIIAQTSIDKYPTRAAWSSDSQRLCIVCDQDTRVVILDGATLAMQREFHQQGAGRLTDAAWSADGRSLAISGDIQIQIYDAASFGSRATIPQRAYSVAFSSDSSQLAIAHDDGTSVFSAADWSKRWQTNGNSHSVQWSNDSRLILSGRHLLDGSGTMLSSLPFTLPRVVSSPSPDGSKIATACDLGLRLWNGEDGSLLHDFPRILPANSQLLWNPKADRLLRLGQVESVNRHTVELLDPQTGQSVLVLNGHDGRVWRACWSPAGDQVATVGEDGNCIQWDAKTGQKIRTLKHTEPQWWVQWSADDRFIGCASQTIITIWDAKTGEQTRRFASLSGRFHQPENSVAGDAPFSFMKDSNLITCLGKSDFEQLDVRSGKITPLGAVTAEGGNYGSRFTCSWSPDFKTLITPTSYRELELYTPGSSTGKAIRFFVQPQWLGDSRRIYGGDNSNGLITGADARTLRRFGVLIPEAGDRQWIVIGPDGHYRASARAADQFAVVALHSNGSLKAYSLDELTSQLKWENDPSKVRLLKLK